MRPPSRQNDLLVEKQTTDAAGRLSWRQRLFRVRRRLQNRAQQQKQGRAAVTKSNRNRFKLPLAKGYHC